MPFHHQFLIAQMLKAVIMLGANRDFLTFKGFNFSGLKGQTKSSRKGLHFCSSRVTLVISSRNNHFVDYLLYHLFKMPKVSVGNLHLQPERVELENLPDIGSYEKFICLSPILLSEPALFDETATRFVDPESDEFSDKLYDLAMQHIEELAVFSADKLKEFSSFQIVPDREYLDKLAARNKKFSRVYPTFDQDVKFEVRGYTFPFYFYAPPEVKEIVFMDGLGALPHKGFGMIDLANEDPTARVAPYAVPGLTTDEPNAADHI